MIFMNPSVFVMMAQGVHGSWVSRLSSKFILNKLRILYSQQPDNVTVFTDNDLIITSILELNFIIVELDL